MQEVMLFATILAPIILAFTEVVKKTVDIPVNYVPIVALVIGVAVGIFGTPFSDLPLEMRIWAGIFAALSATGIFELFADRKGTTK